MAGTSQERHSRYTERQGGARMLKSHTSMEGEALKHENILWALSLVLNWHCKLEHGYFTVKLGVGWYVFFCLSIHTSSILVLGCQKCMLLEPVLFCNGLSHQA